MKKIILSVALISIVTVQAEASILDGGKVSGQIKAMHIITDEINKFTPEEGSGYLGTLKYVTPAFLDGLKAEVGFYINGDTRFMDWSNDKKDAQGMFVAPKGDEKSLLGQAYLEYNKDVVHAKVGRMILNTPLTKIQWSLMPSFYEAAIISAKATSCFSFNLAHFHAISYGSRATTDATLIGEKTWTAGIAQLVLGQGKGTLEQAEFHNLGHGAGVEDTSGMTAVGVSYKGIENLTINMWDYYAYDISNMFYTDINYTMPVMKGTKLSLSAQYLQQSNTGDKLAGELNYSMYGTKAKIENKKWSAYLAYNQSSDDNNGGKFFNAWGADPAYTSSLFSRNVYRQDVTAYKVGGHYMVMKGLKFKVSYADYGQSKTLGWGTTPSSGDATEMGFMLIYKPIKALTLKLFNTVKTSEYDTDTVERKMNHVRLVGWYNF